MNDVLKNSLLTSLYIARVTRDNEIASKLERILGIGTSWSKQYLTASSSLRPSTIHFLNSYNFNFFEDLEAVYEADIVALTGMSRDILLNIKEGMQETGVDFKKRVP